MTEQTPTTPGPGTLGATHAKDNARNKNLIARRAAHFGGSMLFYNDPIQIVRGKGVWLYDEDGKAYLDCYNNVASVGHCHPKVVLALCEQAQLLNTHTRYLHKSIIRYAERLAQLFPEPLDVCLFVCTGTEANELALRIARSITGNMGTVVMENAYHGNSNLMNELSTCITELKSRPPYVVAVEPPNTYRGSFGPSSTSGEQYADLVDDAIKQLQLNGHGLAAFLCDSIFDSQGTLQIPPDYFKRVYEKIRAFGGLCIADEVQAGFARTGTQWGFENYDVVPDIVTLGKPMGAGHPIGAVVTSRKIFDIFSKKNVYFNTFGGNPVSAAVGNAVLDVFEQEALLQHVQAVSPYLREQLNQLQHRHIQIGDIRGLGLFMGIELVSDQTKKTPDKNTALVIAEELRTLGVLIGITGLHGNVIKIRPPLPFSVTDVDSLINALDQCFYKLI